MATQRMKKRASVWIDGEKIKGAVVRRVDEIRREVMVQLNRIPSVESFEDASLEVDVDWNGTEYMAEIVEEVNGKLVYAFNLQTEETRY